MTHILQPSIPVWRVAAGAGAGAAAGAGVQVGAGAGGSDATVRQLGIIPH